MRRICCTTSGSRYAFYFGSSNKNGRYLVERNDNGGRTNMKQLASTRLAPLKHDLKSGVGIGRGGQSKDNKVGSSVLVSADVFVVFLELPL